MKSETSANKKFSITMISNAMSHHQLPFCEYMASQKEISFHFIATKPLSQERLNMGYSDLNYAGKYIVRAYENPESENNAKELVNNSDFVIWGSAPYSYIRSRMMQKKWTFIYSERIFRNGLKDRKILKKIIYYLGCFLCVSHKKLGLLCASAYAAKDFKKFRFRENRMYKWGYFPPDTKKNIDELLSIKEKNSIVWVGRMLSLKHPELAILLAEKLKMNHIPFHLTMVGDGAMFEKIESMIQERNLSEEITMTGSLPKDEVRKIMESSEILLATSDFAEGWGAVINEGMNSACVVVASHAMGATAFLVQDKVNGFIFESGNCEELYNKAYEALTNEKERVNIQRNALKTIQNEWNGKCAGEKLITLCRELKNGNESFSFEEGVCSLAKVKLGKEI